MKSLAKSFALATLALGLVGFSVAGASAAECRKKADKGEDSSVADKTCTCINCDNGKDRTGRIKCKDACAKKIVYDNGEYLYCKNKETDAGRCADVPITRKK
jgi:hypothetical protein